MNYQNLKHDRRLGGFTLVEMLVGLAATLIILLAMVQAFKFASIEMQKGRASLELTNRLRTAHRLLRNDLSRLTVEARSYYNSVSSPKGYLEILDGPKVDINNLADDTKAELDPLVNESTTSLIVGDYDDIFAGTIKAKGKPFRGRGPGGAVIQSPLAEVVWFTTFSDADTDGFAEPLDGDQIRLYRRQLLIAPSVVFPATISNAGGLTAGEVNQIFQNNDISARVTLVSTGPNLFSVTANTLSDLQYRANRFCHLSNPLATPSRLFPQTSPMLLANLRNDPQYLNGPTVFTHRRSSNQNDLLLNDVAAFDIRVFDPAAASLVKRIASTVAPDVVTDYAEPNDVARRLPMEAALGTPFYVGFGVVGGSTFFDESGTEGGATMTVSAQNRTGAYVDLGKAPGLATTFGVAPTGTSRLPITGTPQLRPALNFSSVADFAGGTPSDVYSFVQTVGGTSTVINQPVAVFETGTPAYDRLPTNSFGSNGINDNPVVVAGQPVGHETIVDADERLNPPYLSRIRGIKFVIRLYEPNSKQVSQMTLKQSMVPK